jgi:hypothetical protein
MKREYCEVWENGRCVDVALYSPDHIAPMAPYRAVRTQHRAIVPAPPVREYARNTCTPSRYSAMTATRYEFDDWGNDAELEPVPVVEPEEAPIAVPDWPIRRVVVEPKGGYDA